MRTRKTGPERRDEIVRATLDLAWRAGPDRITTEAIARAIGLSQAAVFRHFPTKAAIWAAVIAWLRDSTARRWAAVLADHAAEPPRRRLLALVESQLDFVRSVPALPAVLLSRELAEDATVRQGLLAAMAAFRAALAGVIAEGVAAGAFRPDLDPERATALVLAVVQGTAMRWLAAGGRFDLVTEGRQALETAIDGLAA
jgi:AcrR family transcriptional regulator